jgi:hypothetical protein
MTVSLILTDIRDPSDYTNSSERRQAWLRLGLSAAKLALDRVVRGDEVGKT